MTVSYFQAEIRELAQFPGMNAAAINEAVLDACDNLAKLKAIYDNLMAACYDDDEF